MTIQTSNDAHPRTASQPSNAKASACELNNLSSQVHKMNKIAAYVSIVLTHAGKPQSLVELEYTKSPHTTV